NEILNFLKNSPKFREKILDKYRDELLLEKFKLPQIISNMEEQLIKEYQQAEKNVVNELHYYNDSLKELQDRPISIWSFKKKWKIKKLINQITSIQENKDILIQDAISPYIIEINEKKKRYDLLMGDF